MKRRAFQDESEYFFSNVSFPLSINPPGYLKRQIHGLQYSKDIDKWSCPHKAGHSLTLLSFIYSLGDIIFKPLCGCFSL